MESAPLTNLPVLGILIFAAVLVVAYLLLRRKSTGDSVDSYGSLSPAGAKELAEQSDIVYLDVRTTKEIAAGSIDGAEHVDVMASGFSTKIEKLDKSKTYVVYCRSGRRSANACNIMSKKGFDNLYNLSGGYLAWTS